MSTQQARPTRVSRLTLNVAASTLLVALAAIGWIATWATELPDPLATHFSLGGAADDFSARGSALLSFAALAIGVPAMIALVTILTSRAYTTSTRFVLALLPGLSAYLAVVLGAALWCQRGLADARAASLPIWMIGAALVPAALVGALAWRVLPRPTTADVAVTELRSRAVNVGSADHIAWFHTATVGPVLLAVIVACFALLVGLGFASPGLWSWVGAALVALCAAALLAFRVTIDRRGLRWRSLIGVPRGQVELGEMAAVSAIEVEPMRYGGWGLRRMPGALGIILRRGSGLRVTRHDGTTVTITVDDAQTAAGLLAALLDGSGRPGGAQPERDARHARR